MKAYKHSNSPEPFFNHNPPLVYAHLTSSVTKPCTKVVRVYSYDVVLEAKIPICFLVGILFVKRIETSVGHHKKVLCLQSFELTEKNLWIVQF